MNNKIGIAVILALGTAIISGVSNVIAKVGVSAANDPVVFTFLKNAAVGLLLVGAIVLFRKMKELMHLSRRQWALLIAIGIVGGSIPFAMFFTGLTMTSALSASLIHKTLFIWVALLAVPMLRERIGALQASALLLLVFGNFALGGINSFRWGTGELLILGATLFWAAENIIAKKVLLQVSSMTVAAARMVIGSIILLGYILVRGDGHMLIGLTGVQWIWTLISAVLLFGYVTTWYSALKRAPATLVASLLVPASLITNVLSQLFLDNTMTHAQVTSAAAMLLGVFLLLWEVRRNHSRVPSNAVGADN